MFIEQVSLYEIFPPPFAEGVCDATLGPFLDFPIGLLELRAVDGAVGWGLIPIGVITREMLEGVFLPLLFQTEIDYLKIEAFWSTCLKRIRNIGPGYAHYVLAGIDIALWDLAAKYSQKPLVKLLGGTRMDIPVYGSNGFINYELPKLVDSIVSLADRGFKTLKMKVGRKGGEDVRDDVSRVKEVCKAVGAGTEIAVDANQCWTVSQALEFASRIENERILWFEEPISAQDFLGYAKLATRSPIKLAAGESLWTQYAFEIMLELKALAYLQPEPTVLGGISGYLKVARLAEKHQVPLISGGFSQLTCSLVAAAPTGLFTEYLVLFMDRFQEIWAESPCLANGQFHIPETPGHGLLPDMRYIGKHVRRGPYIFRQKKSVSIRVY